MEVKIVKSRQRAEMGFQADRRQGFWVGLLQMSQFAALTEFAAGERAAGEVYWYWKARTRGQGKSALIAGITCSVWIGKVV